MVKKSLGLILIGIWLGLGLAACGQSEPTASPTSAPTSNPTNRRPAQPPQPASGPGGATYPHASIKQTTYGSGADEYSIFEPTDPAPKSAPVVVFIHGFLAVNPRLYYGWIEHIVRRGNIVIYPAYQLPLSGAEVFQPALLKAVGAAFGTLKNGQHIAPELDKVSAVGHSLGAVLTATLAAQAGHEGPGATIPVPKAIMIIEPGDCAQRCADANGKVLTRADYSQIKPETKMLVLVGDRDQSVGDLFARFLWKATPQIPATNKDYITIVSDDYGFPALNADHLMPSNGTNLNALNYFGLFKLFDALQSCALSSRDCDTALGGGPAQRFMGKWSDGHAVNELTSTKNPAN